MHRPSASILIGLMLLLQIGCQREEPEIWWVEYEDTTVSYTEQYVSSDGVNYTLSSREYNEQFVTRYPDGEIVTDSAVDTRVPDPARGEYNRMKIERRGDRWYLSFEYRLEREGNEPHEMQGRLELQLVSGTWSQFADGQEVVARVTDRSHEELRSGLERKIGGYFDEVDAVSFAGGSRVRWGETDRCANADAC